MNKKKMDTSDIELMRTEIEILKICQHPNIIRLYDIFENIDYIYIIMEYCPGGDLFSYLEKRKFKIPEERAAIIMNKMCNAVFYFQSYFGVIHRDLKPENILMTSDGDDGDIRILDFGLSKISTPNERCTEPYGTLTYCAPEIILDEPYNKEVDMWSLGVMTYLMVSGKLPFNSDDENKIARLIAFEQPDFAVSSCWKTISKECVDFIKKLLEKDAKKRMVIADAVKHDWFKKFIKKEK
jgi:calcium-dependent protein kinase